MALSIVGVVIKIIKVEDTQLEEITGGSVPYVWIGIAVVALIIFLSGVVDGIANPKACGS